MLDEKSSDPLFSIVVPAFNNVIGLRRCINSVLLQDHGDYELVIVDDGSGPEVAELVGTFEDPRVRYEWQENSGGPAGPRNTGIKLARGQWLCFLDHDDVWSPNKLSRVKDLIEGDPSLDMIFHNEYHVDDSGHVLRSIISGPVEADLYRKMLVSGNRFSTSAVSLRRGFVVEHNLRFSEDKVFVTAEDFELWLQVTLLSNQIRGINDFLGAYYGESGASTDVERHFEAVQSVVKHHLHLVAAKFPKDQALQRNVVSNLEFELAKMAVGDRSAAEFVRHFARALQLSPETVWNRVIEVTRRKSKLRSFPGKITWGVSE